MKRILAVLITFSILTGILFQSSMGFNFRIVHAQTDLVRVLIDQSAANQLDLEREGAKILADYGAFLLVELSGGAALPEGAEPVDDQIYLRGLAIDPSAGGEPPILAELRQQDRGASRGMWIIQFAGPIQDAWLEDLAASGLEVVAYLPEFAYIVWGDSPAEKVAAMADRSAVVAWNGAYHPAYRLDENLRELAAGGESEQIAQVVVQLYHHSDVDLSLKQLEMISEDGLKSVEEVINLVNVRLTLPVGLLAEVAGWPDVYNLETWVEPVKHDEIQAQILAGNLIYSGGKWLPSGTGYLTWLASKGFPTTPSSYPIVDVVDDGIDLGNAGSIAHADFYELGSKSNPDRVIYIGNCTTDTNGNGVGGHGNLNAGIMAGYNNTSGAPYEDGSGYQRGLGISPYGRIAGTKIFNNSGSYDTQNCDWTDAGVVRSTYANGARISTNSWGANVNGAYDSSSQAYDALSRDASLSAGNQELLHIFSAGNDGPGTGTIGSPGTAKNVLTVGATENVRDQGVVDGCNLADSDSADDMADYSSRGPTTDGRIKPDIVAPGSHIQGPASQDPGFNGSGVCGMYPSSSYYPLGGQTLYTWSSGTSHSTPGVAGVAQLLYEYYGRVLSPGQIPSPAMLKALIVNAPRYLNGFNSGGSLPSITQGWGDANMGMLFDGTPRFLLDQSRVFGATGDAYSETFSISTTEKPVQISLVWSDAPGSTTGNAYVNNLNLTVTAGGQTYKGNVFSGSLSTTGGTADVKNNVENVFLPAGTSGQITVTVTAANIAGDGLPNNADATDQDFALVVYNGGPASPQSNLFNSQMTWNDDLGNNNNFADLNEVLQVYATLQNGGTATAENISAELSVISGSASVLSDQITYPNLEINASAQNNQPFLVQVGTDHPCGTNLELRLTVNYTGGSKFFDLNPILIGPTPVTTFAYSGAAVPIPDGDSNGANVTANVPLSYVLTDVNVKVNVTHTWDSDLVFTLTSPQGTPVTLIDQQGAAGDNFIDTVLDDEADAAIADGTAPFTGSFRPDQSLSVLDGEDSQGVWNLNVADKYAQDLGSISGFELHLSWLGTCTPVTIQKVFLPAVRR